MLFSDFAQAWAAPFANNKLIYGFHLHPGSRPRPLVMFCCRFQSQQLTLRRFLSSQGRAAIDFSVCVGRYDEELLLLL